MPEAAATGLCAWRPDTTACLSNVRHQLIHILTKASAGLCHHFATAESVDLSPESCAFAASPFNSSRAREKASLTQQGTNARIYGKDFRSPAGPLKCAQKPCWVRR